MGMRAGKTVERDAGAGRELPIGSFSLVARSYQPLLALPVNPFGLRPRSRRGGALPACVAGLLCGGMTGGGVVVASFTLLAAATADDPSTAIRRLAEPSPAAWASARWLNGSAGMIRREFTVDSSVRSGYVRPSLPVDPPWHCSALCVRH
jgi:hypothetical protein